MASSIFGCVHENMVITITIKHLYSKLTAYIYRAPEKAAYKSKMNLSKNRISEASRTISTKANGLLKCILSETSREELLSQSK